MYGSTREAPLSGSPGGPGPQLWPLVALPLESRLSRNCAYADRVHTVCTQITMPKYCIKINHRGIIYQDPHRPRVVPARPPQPHPHRQSRRVPDGQAPVQSRKTLDRRKTRAAPARQRQRPAARATAPLRPGDRPQQPAPRASQCSICGTLFVRRQGFCLFSFCALWCLVCIVCGFVARRSAVVTCMSGEM